MLESYAAWIFWRCTSISPTGKCAALPGYGGRGKVLLPVICRPQAI